MSAAAEVHQAITGFLDEDELAVGWVLTIDVAGPDERRYLKHRAGGGVDGEDAPMVWTALGMLQAAVAAGADQLDLSDDDD